MKLLVIFICLIMCPLMGCTFQKGKSTKLDIPVIDLARVYPLKEILLQDIADMAIIRIDQVIAKSLTCLCQK